MFRKLLLSAVLATGTATGLTLTPAAADAAPPVAYDHDRDHDHDRHGRRFEVLVRHHGYWDSHGTYRSWEDARRAARWLERQGHDVRIERN